MPIDYEQETKATKHNYKLTYLFKNGEAVTHNVQSEFNDPCYVAGVNLTRDVMDTGLDAAVWVNLDDVSYVTVERVEVPKQTPPPTPEPKNPIATPTAG